jgi:hypothetical protein
MGAPINAWTTRSPSHGSLAAATYSPRVGSPPPARSTIPLVASPDFASSGRLVPFDCYMVGYFFPSCSVDTEEMERAKRKRDDARFWASRRRGWALAAALEWMCCGRRPRLQVAVTRSSPIPTVRFVLGRSLIFVVIADCAEGMRGCSGQRRRLAGLWLARRRRRAGLRRRIVHDGQCGLDDRTLLRTRFVAWC